MHRTLLRTMPAPLYGAIRQAWRWLRPWLPLAPFERSYPEFPGPVHAEDHMLRTAAPADRAHYRDVGLQAYARMEEALARVGRSWTSARSVLDYGCGHGRVLRWLRARHAQLDLTAADINRQAVRFCSSRFRATGLLVPAQLDRLTLPARWDVIWVGSVFTHLSGRDGELLLRTLAAALTPGGLLLFTTHGELIPERLEEYGHRVRSAAGAIAAALRDDGVHFIAPDAFTGAVTFHARTAVRSMIENTGLHPVAHWPRGWDDHQDVWAAASPLPRT